MLRKLLNLLHPREALWIAPFLCIALVSLGLLRPLPHFPLPTHSRTVVGSDGVAVRIAMPSRGIALATNAPLGMYLEDTHAPQLLVYAGNSDVRKTFASDPMNWVFPEVLKDDGLWNNRIAQRSASPFIEVESLIKYDPGVYLACAGPTDLMRSLGLPVLNSRGSCGGRQKPVSCNGSPASTYWAHYSEGPLFIPLRVETALTGDPQLADERMTSYCKVLADLRQELQPSTLSSLPRVWMDGEYKGNLSRAGVVDATADPRLRGDDAERILIMDPDMIFLSAVTPRVFMLDPRWQGLKAVRDRRVYQWAQSNITVKPIQIRWLAEIAHPERLQPKARQQMRDRMMNEFGYRLSDDQIDQLLHVGENSGSVGTERFTRDRRTVNKQEVPQ